MKFHRPLLPVAALLAFSFLAIEAPAQTATKDAYKPEVGQPGKDVVWVPTPQSLVEMMLDVVKLTPADFVMDLGSGDGRTVITAAKRGARAMGIEYNPEMVELAKRNAKAAGVEAKATFVKQDLFQSDLSKATVITMFLLNDINIKLRPKILDLKPGTRVVSNTFQMGDWEHDAQVVATDGCNSYCTAYHWVVPAKVGGTWKLGNGVLTLKQQYQKISGTLSAGGKDVALQSATLRGDEIRFIAGGTEYTGKATATGLEGTTKAGARWTAVRTER